MLRFVNTRCNFQNINSDMSLLDGPSFLCRDQKKKSSVASPKARVLFASHVYKQSAFLHSLT